MINIDNIWTIVGQTRVQILTVDFFGEIKCFIVDSFSPKTRDVYFNEARGAREVTDLIEHFTFQLTALNPVTLEDRIQGRPKRDFKFGHDNYMWFISQKENIY